MRWQQTSFSPIDNTLSQVFIPPSDTVSQLPCFSLLSVCERNNKALAGKLKQEPNPQRQPAAWRNFVLSTWPFLCVKDQARGPEMTHANSHMYICVKKRRWWKTSSWFCPQLWVLEKLVLVEQSGPSPAAPPVSWPAKVLFFKRTDPRSMWKTVAT